MDCACLLQCYWYGSYQQLGYLQACLAEQYKPQRIHTKVVEALIENMPTVPKERPESRPLRPPKL